MSDYLFFASFPPPERVSRHLLICARAQKPERFFLMLHFMHIMSLVAFFIQVSSFLGGVASVCCYSPMLYVAQHCQCHALGLLLGLLLSLAIESKAIAHMYTVSVIGHIIISGL